MELAVVLVALVLAALLHPTAVSADKHSSGFSLRLVPSPGWNRTFRVDDDGILHLLHDDDGATELRPSVRWDKFAYGVSTTIGTGHGRKTYVLALDTASNLTWMQCEPCQHPFPQKPPPFDPAASTSFRHVPLVSNLCLPPGPAHPPEHECRFHATRLDGAEASGVLGFETLAFASTEHGATAEVAFVVIGCAHSSARFRSGGELAGVLGMGRQKPSFMWKLRQRAHDLHRFSYCPFMPRQGRHGFLRFGGDVPDTAHKQSTRLQHMADAADPAFNAYFVDLVGISVGGHRLPGITRETFERRRLDDGRWAGGCAFDAGTPLTKMVPAAHQALVHALTEHLKALGVPVVHRFGYPLCFRGKHVLLSHMPAVTLHFAEEGVRLVIPPNQLFVADGHDACLVVQSSPEMTVIGALQTVNTRLVFDLAADKLYFAPEQCQLDRGGH